MKIKIEVEQEKEVFGVRTNTDLNEGRGQEYIKFICEKEATAIRLSKKAYVQGSDAKVVKLKAYKLYGKWYYEGVRIEQANELDYHMEEELIKKRITEKAKKAALDKAKKLGLTDREIELLA